MFIRIRRSRALVTVGCFLFAAFAQLVSVEQAQAHFPFGHWHGGFRPHFAYRHHYYSGFGSHGFGYRHFPSSYLYINSYAGTYPFGICPPAFCNTTRARYFSIGYYPAVTYPVLTYPVYSAPVYYPPVSSDPCWSSFGTNYRYQSASDFEAYGTASNYSAVRGPRDYFATESIASVRNVSHRSDTNQLASIDLQDKLEKPLMQRSLRDVPADESEVVKLVSQRDISSQKVSKLRVLQPYSPIWTKAAAGLVDDMVEAGHFSDAAASCRSMEKIEQPKGAGVYLRQGLMRYFSDTTHTQASIENVLDLLNDACQAGSELSSAELPSHSLTKYFSACSVSVKDSLENLSKEILTSPTKTTRELLLLSVLLKLDGKPEKAKLFAMEVSGHSTDAIDFRWDNVLSKCLE